MSANEKLIKNLENQVGRVVQQLQDLEECRGELSPVEYDTMKEETLEQIKEFSESLVRMNKGDLSINSQISQMKMELQQAISSSFNTVEMIKMFGLQNANELEKQLLTIDEEYKLKRITQDEMETRKVLILDQLKKQGHSISAGDFKFLESKNQQYMQQLEVINDD